MENLRRRTEREKSDTARYAISNFARDVLTVGDIQTTSGVYIDPTAEMVIARFASHHIAGNVGIDPMSLPAYEAVARHLMATRR